MKLPGSLIKKRTDEISKRSRTNIVPVVTQQKDNAPMPSPIQSPVSMSAAPAEIQLVDNKPDELKKIDPPVVDMLMNKLEKLEKRQSPEKVVTPSPPADVPVKKESDIVPAVEATTPVKPELTEAHLIKLSKPELMSLCSTNKVYVKLPATRKVLIAAILKN
ncbi:hypothetical protein EXVG_00089 [Emiliania huxleyi virus 202]|nr:hypothetical protein EXVG_00089 [Emiliania huxleyi virus 202]AHA54457.1 hypothetical protein EhV18_00411 [Emiliania huxleyi virus 18]AHA55499.1 hypothetical protein EhV156_00404 [Emiliania huxleyi virus 156]